jgi:SAM-dependent methyltransferase
LNDARAPGARLLDESRPRATGPIAADVLRRAPMHFGAMKHARWFFDTYLGESSTATVVDIGAQDVNGSLREVAPEGVRYVGVDFVKGKGVDVILEDPYRLPFEDASVDVIVSSSCFEHSELFWVLFLEILRVLKPSGLLYLNAPSNGYVHRYPVDCWRFYPDAGRALVTWAKRNGLSPALTESFVGDMDAQGWIDFVAVFVKDEAHLGDHPRRMKNTQTALENARDTTGDELGAYQHLTGDQRLLRWSGVYQGSRLVTRIRELIRGPR